MKHLDLKVVVVAVALLTAAVSSVSCLNSDGLSLLALKSAVSTDPTESLAGWSESDSTPCEWTGVSCSSGFLRVTQIRLDKRGLSGYLPSELGTLTSLTHLSLSHNNFSNTIPLHLFNATSLTHLDLSHNSFAGPVSPQIHSLTSLRFLDLSSNLFNSSLPDSLPRLSHLSGTLNLSYNSFSGHIPPSFAAFPVSLSLDLRHNNLSGQIPQLGSLLNQGPTAFAANPCLCGFPLTIPCPPPPPALLLPLNPTKPFLLINPTSSHTTTPKPTPPLVPIVSALLSFVLALALVSLCLLLLLRKKCNFTHAHKGDAHDHDHDHNHDAQDGKFVVLDESFELDLEDLLRASAYVLGKSNTGIVYKVVLPIPTPTTAPTATPRMAVAVRRLPEAAPLWSFKDFQAYLDPIARLQHHNIVPLRAYYYATHEKLLISDFIPNGTLYSSLHSVVGVSDSLPPLSWAARLKIAQGVARGLTHIHECNPRKYVHGSITSSKILLDDNLEPYISGLGLAGLVSNANKSTYTTSLKHSSSQNGLSSGIKAKTLVSSSCSYLAPEAISSSRLTQKCDVYSFGIVLLELLTGRLPEAGPEKDEKELKCFVRRVFRDERPLSEIIDPRLVHEVYAKKQVLAMFHVALNCTELVPEMRPRMKAVLESLERVESH